MTYCNVLKSSKSSLEQNDNTIFFKCVNFAINDNGKLPPRIYNLVKVLGSFVNEVIISVLLIHLK